MRFAILGPLAIEHGGARVTLARSQRRGLLAYLLLNHGRLVPPGELLEALWGGAEPSTARQQIQTAVHAIRAQLRRVDPTNEVLVGGAAGYRTEVAGHELDLLAFNDRIVRAQGCVSAGRPDEAVRHLRAALDLWRGPAFADATGAFVESARAMLTDRYLVASEDLCDALLAMGCHGEVLTALGALLAEHPLRERLHAQHMLALYRGGRAIDALDAYRAYARRLAEEHGIAPGAELQRLERAVLNREPDLDPPTPARAVPELPPPAQLPAVAVGFVGRAKELADLDQLILNNPDGAVVISAIGGVGGVGKTAIALAWAHRVRHRYPDGQLYANLHGYSTIPPVRPLAVLGQFLGALGVPREQVPLDQDAAAALYRTRLAGRRVLVVLDNAHHPDQVRPLLPGDTGCLTVVTSRDRLTGLAATDGARRISLEALSTEDALALLSNVVGSDRVSAAPEAAVALVDACSRLPLALRIVGAHLDDNPGRSLSDHLARLRAERELLDGMEVDGDSHASVRTAVRQSYESLEPLARRTLRLLGLAPGTDLALADIAALLGSTVDKAAASTERLVAASLVIEQASGRFAMHDLVRLFALERGRVEETDADRRAAIDRLYDFLLGLVDAAADVLYPQVVRLPPRAGSPARGRPGYDEDEAREWLEASLPTLVAAVRQAGEADSETAWRLADALRGYFWLSRRMDDWCESATSGLSAAERASDRAGVAAMHLSLGVALRAQSKHAEAMEHLQLAMDVARAEGLSRQEASAAGSLAIAFAELSDLPRAVEYFGAARAAYASIGGHAGEAVALNNLGSVRMNSGDFLGARIDLLDALALHRKTGASNGVALALTNLGLVHRELGELATAATYTADGLALHTRHADPYGQALARAVMASIDRELADLVAAERHYIQLALDLTRQIGDSRLEAAALTERGAIRRVGADTDGAISDCLRALAIAEASDNAYGQIEARLGLAEAAVGAGRHDDAIDHAGLAVAAARAHGYRSFVGDGLLVEAEVHLRREEFDEARTCATEALMIHRDAGRRLAQERARSVLAHLDGRQP